MKILIVEDEPSLRVIMEDALLDGHDVRAVGAGARALRVLRSWQPDVLITDLALPGLPGEMLAQAAASLPCPARVVVMSADEERLESARLLADVVLPKPFRVQDLRWAVEWPVSMACVH